VHRLGFDQDTAHAHCTGELRISTSLLHRESNSGQILTI